MRLSQRWLSIISGEDGGIVAVLARCVLRGLSVVYWLVVTVRNRLYDWGLLSVVTLSVPVICVGNITVGGTGKTPMVVWLCRYLLDHGRRVVVLTRSYKGKDEQGNDEVRLLRRALPDVPIVIDSDRVAGGARAIAEYGADILVMDDGFGHRRLGRDLDIVLIDSTCPFGYGWLLPGGLLREGVGELRRGGVAVLTRVDQANRGSQASQVNQAKQSIQAYLSSLREHIVILLGPVAACGGKAEKLVASSSHRPVGLFDTRGERVDAVKLKGDNSIAFCGIGNPSAFISTLSDFGINVVGEYFFEDHHDYSDKDWDVLADLAESRGANWLVTTEKDWVKLVGLIRHEHMDRVLWLKIESEITDGRDELCSCIDSALAIGS